MDGKAVRIHSIQDAIDHGIGYVPEDRLSEGLFLEQTDRPQCRSCAPSIGLRGPTGADRSTVRSMGKIDGVGRLAAHQDR